MEERTRSEAKLTVANEKINFLQGQIKDLGRKFEEEKSHLLEKIKRIENGYLESFNEETREKAKLMEMLKEKTEGCEWTISGLEEERSSLSEKVRDLQMQVEILNSESFRLKNEVNEKEKERIVLLEKVEFLEKEKAQLKNYSSYTQDINEKLINSLINESSSNIQYFKQKKYNVELGNSNSQNEGSLNKDRPDHEFHFREENVLQEIKPYSFIEKRKGYKAEYEVTVQGIIELEKELVELINKYKNMARKISVLQILSNSFSKYFF